MKSKNVLVFPCGSEIGLEIHNALKFDKAFELLGVSTVANHGKFVYKNYIEGLGIVTDPNFIDDLNTIIRENKIDFIYPAHDDVVLFMAQNQGKINAKVIGSNSSTSEIARSKEKTYDFFCRDNFIPKIYKSIHDINSFPVFIKPKIGQGSKGAKLVNSKKELEALENIYEFVICEYLSGDEYTIDCFTDRFGKLRFVGQRERRRTSNGVSVNSITLPLEDRILEIAENINSKLKFRGTWFFQVKKDGNGEYKLLEIATRIAGTMGLHRGKGVNLPLLGLYDAMNFDVEIDEGNYKIEVDRALVNRFKVSLNYKIVLIDFDDTITYKEKVNPYIMMFLYQEKNKGKEIVLITKHKNDIKDTLNTLSICENLFTEIIHITREEEKYTKVNKYKNAIFIDDSHRERNEIKKNLKIESFDISQIEALIDWTF